MTTKQRKQELSSIYRELFALQARLAAVSPGEEIIIRSHYGVVHTLTIIEESR
jgi:hypothetical protein